MGHVTIFRDDSNDFELDKDVQARLELLDCDIVIDLNNSELQFIFPDKTIVVFDFDNDFIIGETTPRDYLIEDQFKNNVLDYYQDQIDKLSSKADTDIFLYGEGYYQKIFIKIYNKYIVFMNVLVDDDEDFDGDPDPHDPDDGEKIPDGDFCFEKNKKELFHKLFCYT
jgi:hypothetical protein